MLDERGSGWRNGREIRMVRREKRGKRAGRCLAEETLRLRVRHAGCAVQGLRGLGSSFVDDAFTGRWTAKRKGDKWARG